MKPACASVALLLAAEQGLASPVPKTTQLLAPDRQIWGYETEVQTLCEQAASRTDIRANGSPHWCGTYDGDEAACITKFASTSEGYKMCTYDGGVCSAGEPFICPKTDLGEEQCSALASKTNLRDDDAFCKVKQDEESCSLSYITSSAGIRMCEWDGANCESGEPITRVYCPSAQTLCDGLSNKTDTQNSGFCNDVSTKDACLNSYFTTNDDRKKLCKWTSDTIPCQPSYAFDCDTA